jgi:hypothetical protein
MLPLLMEQQSAGAVALSCKQLRTLCQSGRVALWLGDGALQDTAALACIPARFPACKVLQVVPRSREELAFYLPDALDVLTGWVQAVLLRRPTSTAVTLCMAIPGRQVSEVLVGWQCTTTPSAVSLAAVHSRSAV